MDNGTGGATATLVHKAPDNNAMHAKSGLRVVLKWKIFRPDSVIAAVIQTKEIECRHISQ